MSHPHVAAGLAWAKAVVAGTVPACRWVKLACERQLGDLRRKGWSFRWDPDAAEDVCRAVEMFPHIKGAKASAGELLQLEPWQSFILTTVFGWVTAGGARRFRRSYCEIPRGNGKSALTAPVGLYCAFLEEEAGASVVSAATTRDQAKHVFETAQHMARSAEGFTEGAGVTVQAHEIVQPASLSRFEPVSSDAKGLDGHNLWVGIIDELHAHPNRKVYDAIETGAGKRAGSLIWVITTAGTDTTGICYEVRALVTKVLDRTVEDEQQFGIIFSIDDDDNWQSEDALRKANPNWGVSVEPEFVLGLQRKAVVEPSARANFKTKHLNIWENSAAPYLDAVRLVAAGDPQLTRSRVTHLPLVMGLDLASKTDIAARADVHWEDRADGRHYWAFATSYLPQAAIDAAQHASYPGWAINGWLTVHPGAEIEFSRIEADIVAAAKASNLIMIGYDPWKAGFLSERLRSEHGLPVMVVRQGAQTLSQPMKELDAAIRSGRFHMPADPAFLWQLSNLSAKADDNDNVRPVRERESTKIDAAVAVLDALAVIMSNPVPTAEPFSVEVW